MTTSNTDCSKCAAKSKGFMCSTSQAISEKISSVKAHCRYKNGESIFRSGETPLGLFSVRSGIVKLESLNEEGHAHTLRLLGAGDILGYRSFFSGGPYSSSAVVIEEAEICFVPGNEARRLFASHAELGLKMISQLSSDLQHAETKWVDQIDKGAAARVADALLFLNERFQGSHWTRREIAEWAGTTTETVIRCLAQLEKEGIITQKYKNFIILSEPRLREKAAA